MCRFCETLKSIKSFLVSSREKLSIFYFKSLRRPKHPIRQFNRRNIRTKFSPFPFFFLCSLKGADAGNGIRVFVPDIGMFIASLTIWLLCRNIVQKPVTDEAAQSNLEFENEELVNPTPCLFLLWFLRTFTLNELKNYDNNS